MKTKYNVYFVSCYGSIPEFELRATFYNEDDAISYVENERSDEAIFHEAFLIQIVKEESKVESSDDPKSNG